MSTIDGETAKLVVDLIEEDSGNNKKKPVKDQDIEESKQQDKKKEEKKEVQQKTITIPTKTSVKDLGNYMGVEPVKIIKKLMDYGLMVNINAEIDFESAIKLAGEFGFDVKEQKIDSQNQLVKEVCDDPKDMKFRPPVVTVMGRCNP